MSNPCLQPVQLITSYPDSMEEPSREVRFIKQTMRCLRFSANTYSIKQTFENFTAYITMLIVSSIPFILLN